MRRRLSFLGPAFIAAVAYVDPGNFATNTSAGASFGYRLLWVVVLANLMAALIQYLAAKLGTVSGQGLAELCRDHLPRPLSIALWVIAEFVAMATDLAEFVGAALALHLLFGLPLLLSGLVTGVVALIMLEMHRRGRRRFERLIAAALALILAAFIYVTFKVGIDGRAAVQGFVPHLGGSEALLLASAIIGATVMPHAIWVHSSLTTSRDRQHLPLSIHRLDVLLALGLAGLVNVAILVAAAGLSTGGSGELSQIFLDYRGQIGPVAALVFAAALLVSGLTSSSVGTLAGEVIMNGFTRYRLSLLLRRLLTMLPAMVILGLGLEPSAILIISQLVLSLGLPFALVPLIYFSAQDHIMGGNRSSRSLTMLAALVATVVIVINLAFLVSLTMH